MEKSFLCQNLEALILAGVDINDRCSLVAEEVAPPCRTHARVARGRCRWWRSSWSVAGGGGSGGGCGSAARAAAIRSLWTRFPLGPRVEMLSVQHQHAHNTCTSVFNTNKFKTTMHTAHGHRQFNTNISSTHTSVQHKHQFNTNMHKAHGHQLKTKHATLVYIAIICWCFILVTVILP